MKFMPAKSFLPTTAVLETTFSCNHSCVFCSCPWDAPGANWDKMAELRTDDWLRIISKLCCMGVTDFALTGGEPLVRPDLRHIIAHAASLATERFDTADGELVSTIAPPKIHLLSNGLLVDDSILEMCKQFDIQLSMSLPGLKTFKEHTGIDNASGVLRNFSKAKAIGLRTVAGVTVTRLNIGELRETLFAALDAGAEQILLNRFLPGGRGLANLKRLAVSSVDVKDMLDIAEEVLEAANRFGSLGTETPKCVIDPTKYKRINVGAKCSAARGFFVVGPDGHVRVCNHSPVRLCHASQIDTLKNDQYWRRFAFRQYLPQACHDCPESLDCDCGCREAAHIVNGSPDAIDPIIPPRPPSFRSDSLIPNSRLGRIPK